MRAIGLLIVFLVVAAKGSEYPEGDDEFEYDYYQTEAPAEYNNFNNNNLSQITTFSAHEVTTTTTARPRSPTRPPITTTTSIRPTTTTETNFGTIVFF